MIYELNWTESTTHAHTHAQTHTQRSKIYHQWVFYMSLTQWTGSQRCHSEAIKSLLVFHQVSPSIEAGFVIQQTLQAEAPSTKSISLPSALTTQKF